MGYYFDLNYLIKLEHFIIKGENAEMRSEIVIEIFQIFSTF